MLNQTDYNLVIENISQIIGEIENGQADPLMVHMYRSLGNREFGVWLQGFLMGVQHEKRQRYYLYN